MENGFKAVKWKEGKIWVFGFMGKTSGDIMGRCDWTHPSGCDRELTA